MVSRSTERRRRIGLTQVSIDVDEALWPEIMVLMGARTKTEAVNRALNAFIAASRAESALKLQIDRDGETSSYDPDIPKT